MNKQLEEIEQLAALKEKGILTADEFSKKKKEIWGITSNEKKTIDDNDNISAEKKKRLIKSIKDAGTSISAIGWLQFPLWLVLYF